MCIKMLYFAYGSNMGNEQMQRRCPGSIPMGPAKLANYGLRFDGVSQNWSGAAVANIEPATGHEVWGSLYEVGEEHLRSLDRFEHAPVNYRRRLMKVMSTKMGQREAVAYIRTGRDLGSSNDRYVWEVLKGAIQNRIPIDYLAQIVSKSGVS